MKSIVEKIESIEGLEKLDKQGIQVLIEKIKRSTKND